MLATTTFQPPATTSKYFMAHPGGNPGGPSPPNLASDYPYHQGVCTLDTAYPPPGMKRQFRNESRPGVPVGENYAMDVPHVQPRRTAAIEWYLPAALRRTDYSTTRPLKTPNHPRAPDTPPGSKGNSFSSNDDSNATTGFKHIDDALRRANIKPDAQGGVGAGISQRTWEELKHPLGEVGPPTTAHWKPDSIAKNCAICKTAFKWYWRRHHCRRCGEVICSSCATNSVRLDENAHFHPAGVISKSCSPCYKEWRLVEAVSYKNLVPDDEPAASVPEVDESGHGPYYRWSTF